MASSGSSSATESNPSHTSRCAYSSAWVATTVLVTCINNFRCNRGPVFGILKGFFGLSIAIFTDLYYVLFADDPASFLFMLAFIPFSIFLFGMFFLREIPPAATNDEEESTYVTIFNAVVVIVTIYLLVFGFMPNPSALVSQVFTVVLLLLLVAPLGILVHSYLKARMHLEGCV
ncbi:hypothetical protein AAZV13_12G103550 [Glycine max]|nr:hypothetical protein GmHk_12G034629 [Glycine max]